MALQTDKQKLTLAVPKGRILDQLMPISGKLVFSRKPPFWTLRTGGETVTNCDDIDVIRVRSFDVATFRLMAQLTCVWPRR